MTSPYESNTRESQQQSMPSAQEQAEAMKDKARSVADNAMVQGKGQIDRYSDKAANEIETVANSFKAAATERPGSCRSLRLCLRYRPKHGRAS